MAPWIDCCPGCPKSPLGPKQPNLAPANPSAEPTATPANENKTISNLPWLALQASHTLHIFCQCSQGPRTPVLPLLPPDGVQWISFRSPFLAAAGLGLSRSDPASALLHARVPEHRSFPGQARALWKIETRGFVQKKMRGDRKDKLFSRFRFLRKGWRV